MLAATKVKMSGSENKVHKNSYDISFTNSVTRNQVVVVQKTAKKCAKKWAARAELLFCQLDLP